MKVGVVYAEPERHAWLRIELPEGATVRDAIDRSGILQKFPRIDLETQKVGVFGKVVPLDRALSDGDRIEIYRPITADPATVKRRDQGDDD
ncbi:MAG: RnfH family protein [Chromatiales bacterium]|nr:RnfH family protein [Chromatiales bacterium]